MKDSPEGSSYGLYESEDEPVRRTHFFPIAAWKFLTM